MKTRHHILPVLFAVLVAAPALAQAQSGPFRWHGTVAPGAAIEIKGVNGKVVAGPAGGNEVEVVAEKRARHSDPESVTIDVVTHGDGVTICAVYPSRDGERANECAPGDGGRMNVRDNDVNVDFTVKVPAGVRFIGKTVNGDVEAERLAAAVSLNTVNGSVNFSTSSTGHAKTVNGSIRGDLGRADWTDTLDFKTVNGSVVLTLPPDLSTDVKAQTVNGDIATDFPLTVTGRWSRRRVEGTIGGGGRMLSIETVNGGITLKRP